VCYYLHAAFLFTINVVELHMNYSIERILGDFVVMVLFN